MHIEVSVSHGLLCSFFYEGRIAVVHYATRHKCTSFSMSDLGLPLAFVVDCIQLPMTGCDLIFPSGSYYVYPLYPGIYFFFLY